jgi:hypothetical protein
MRSYDSVSFWFPQDRKKKNMLLSCTPGQVGFSGHKIKK